MIFIEDSHDEGFHFNRCYGLQLDIHLIRIILLKIHWKQDIFIFKTLKLTCLNMYTVTVMTAP